MGLPRESCVLQIGDSDIRFSTRIGVDGMKTNNLLLVCSSSGDSLLCKSAKTKQFPAGWQQHCRQRDFH